MTPSRLTGGGVSCPMEKVRGNFASEMTVGDLILPGSEEPEPECGTYELWECSDCGTPFRVSVTCKSRTCPRCAPRWAIRSAERAAFRIWTFFKRRARRGRLVHAVLSFGDLDPQYTTGWVREITRRAMREKGILGGCIVIHPFRTGHNGEFDRWGVHCHVIGWAGGHIEPGPDGEGLLFKVIRDRHNSDYKGFRTHSQLARCLRYELGHAGIGPRRHALTYFGKLSYNQFTDEDLKEASPEGWRYHNSELELRRCPNCGSEFIRMVFDGCQGSLDGKRQAHIWEWKG